MQNQIFINFDFTEILSQIERLIQIYLRKKVNVPMNELIRRYISSMLLLIKLMALQ